MDDNYYQIFRSGSRTYYYSSWFFQKPIRDQVSVLYAFVRIIDDLVDNTVQQKDTFYAYWDSYRQALKGVKSGVRFLDDLINLARTKNFDFAWIDAFWQAMEMDIVKPIHQTLAETEEYMYGSAEVIGLMMARIMDLPKKADLSARMLGKAMQYANFIRDVDEDMKMNRNYLQVNGQEDYLRKFGTLKDRFTKWQSAAEAGYKFIPKRYLIPTKTAAEMYKWTINKIAENPAIVFKKKIKPSKMRILSSGLLIAINQ